MDIDAVYTWVDGEDIEHAKLRAQYRNRTKLKRWRDNGELRHSLRSLEMFAPWFRMIHIVTNGQVPKWLNTDHPKIRLVTHREIYRWPEHLPTFNSVSIETHLHRIPDLAEHFVYFNDDMFLGNACEKSLFFRQGGRIRVSRHGRLPLRAKNANRDEMYIGGQRHARSLLASEFGSAYTFRPNHQAKPYTKGLLIAAEKRWPNIAEANSRSRFRAASDVAMNMGVWNNFAAATRRGVFSGFGGMCIGVGKSARKAKIRFEKAFAARPQLLCINDSGIGKGTRPILQDFLERYYPTPCGMELS